MLLLNVVSFVFSTLVLALPVDTQDAIASIELSRDTQLEIVLESLPTICTGLNNRRITEDRPTMNTCLKNFALRANDPNYGAGETKTRSNHKRGLVDQLRGNAAGKAAAGRNNNNANANRGQAAAAAKPATQNAFSNAAKKPATNDLETIDLATFSESIDLKDVTASTPSATVAPPSKVSVGDSESASPASASLAKSSTASGPLAPLPAGSTGSPASSASQSLAVKTPLSQNAGKAVGVAAPAPGLSALRATA